MPGHISLIAGHKINYEFPARAELVVSNLAFYTIKATCDVKTEKDSASVQITLLNNGHTCIINDATLNKADASVVIPMQTGSKLNLSVDSGAKVKLLNQSDSSITIDCETK
jgi:hypothetical protein